MRNALAAALTALAAEHPELVVLSGDIGNRLFDPFKTRFADRFFNCGIAEANMTTVAAGLALEGFRPVTYTISAFNSYRCFEQIRLDVCYQNLPVIIVGVGAGLSYAPLNASHHSLEDVGIMRTLPNMTVMAPGDSYEAAAALKAAIRHSGPVFIRIGKKGEPLVYDSEPELVIGKALPLRSGKRVAVLCSGTMLKPALDTAAALDTALWSFPTVKPLDEALLHRVFTHYELVVTCEEHSLIGGFGSAVAEWCAGTPYGRKLLRFGTPDRFLHNTGNRTAALARVGLEAPSMIEAIGKRL